MDEAIIQHIKPKYNLLIGERTAELIKITIGSAYPGDEIETMEIRGHDLVAGVSKIVEISDEEIRAALMEPGHQVVESVRIALERTLPVLASDIVERGFYWRAAAPSCATSMCCYAKRPACRSLSLLNR
jgi:rod shape-determining protein MreB